MLSFKLDPKWLKPGKKLMPTSKYGFGPKIVFLVFNGV
jgi:hypothetical protein